MRRTVTCVVCGIPFPQTTPKQTACGVLCRNEQLRRRKLSPEALQEMRHKNLKRGREYR